MDFELELWDESIIELKNESEIFDLIDKLDGREKKYIAFKKGRILFLRIESDAFKRIHLYRRSLNKIKQTVQPISKTVCKNLVSDFFDGKRNWYKGINFIDTESFEPTQNYKIEEKEETLEELEGRERKTIILAISGIFISILFGIYMYSRLDTMSNMNPKIYAILMGGIIGGPVLFIYLIFEVFELRKKIEKKRNKR
ncbi:MAG: hypothetical protein ACMZ7B_06190 [Balneola sp.]